MPTEKNGIKLKSSGYAFGTITKNQLMLIMIMVFGNFGDVKGDASKLMDLISAVQQMAHLFLHPNFAADFFPILTDVISPANNICNSHFGFLGSLYWLWAECEYFLYKKRSIVHKFAFVCTKQICESVLSSFFIFTYLSGHPEFCLFLILEKESFLWLFVPNPVLVLACFDHASDFVYTIHG